MAPVVPTAEITASLYEADNATLVRTLPTSFDRRWQHSVLDAGTGSISFPLAASTEWGAITAGRIIRMSYRGQPAFAFAPRQRTERMIPSGTSPQVVTFEGPGVLATLDDAVVKLRPGTESFAGPTEKRLFGWQCPEFDDSGWSNLTLGPSIYDPTPPLAWPSPFTNRVWLSGAGDGSTVLARRTFTLDATKAVAIFVSADDGARVWLDGVPIGVTDMPPSSSLDRTWAWVPLVEAGTHTLAIEAVDGGGGGRWFACAVYGLSSITGDSLNTSTFMFQTAYQPDSVVLDPWKLYQFDGVNRPGLTWGSILSKVVAEAQARSRLAGVTLDFDATTDSNGNAWPVMPDFVTDVGVSIPALIAKGAESEADTWIEPDDLVLRSVRWRERGSFWTLPISPPRFGGGAYGVAGGGRSPNLSELTHTVDMRSSAVQVVARHEGGYSTSGTGPERFADFGGLNEASALATAATMRDARVDDAESFAVSTVPTNGDEIVYDDYGLGDAVSVPTGAPGSESWANARVVGITCGDDASNHHRGRVEIELASTLTEFQSLTQRRLDRQRVGVQSDALTAPETLGTGLAGGVISEERVLFGQADSNALLSDVVGDSTEVSFPSRRSRPFRFVARLRTPDLADVTVDVRKNGSVVHTITIPGGDDVAEGWMGSINGTWPDRMDMVITDPGTTARGLSVEVYFAPAVAP